jgi:Fic family protein
MTKLAYTADQHAQWIDLQMRKAAALAAIDAIAYAPPDDLAPLDAAAVADLEMQRAAIEALQADHSGLSRAEYKQAIETAKVAIRTHNEALAAARAANEKREEAARKACDVALRKARKEYRDLLEEERTAFGFVTDPAGLPDDES